MLGNFFKNLSLKNIRYGKDTRRWSWINALHVADFSSLKENRVDCIESALQSLDITLFDISRLILDKHNKKR